MTILKAWPHLSANIFTYLLCYVKSYILIDIKSIHITRWFMMLCMGNKQCNSVGLVKRLDASTYTLSDVFSCFNTTTVLLAQDCRPGNHWEGYIESWRRVRLRNAILQLWMTLGFRQVLSKAGHYSSHCLGNLMGKRSPWCCSSP